MKAIWASDPAEYHGRLVDFDPIVSRPRPVQTLGPNVHVGGAGPRACRRTLRYADGWMPLLHRGDDDVDKHVRNLGAEAEALGRSLQGFEVSVCDPPFDPRMLDAYQEVGIDRVLMRVTPDDADKGLADLDRIERLARGIA
jgi:alkanesulfonate monooxygenase SsuD/methylene tetrahydromethanopterin reductase-like flavin-dependent oxidoreductase (luciferase family)